MATVVLQLAEFGSDGISEIIGGGGAQLSGPAATKRIPLEVSVGDMPEKKW